MHVGFVGLGHLGFPCAVAVAVTGHQVLGYDIDARLIERYRSGYTPAYEPGLAEQYARVRTRLTFARSLDETVRRSEIIFVAVPTPHAPEHDGSWPYDGVGRDFDSTIIRDCLGEVARAIERYRGDGMCRTVLIVSTVVPGTVDAVLYPEMQRHIGASCGEAWELLYSPFFIGQSTVVRDFLDPEFVLLGRHPDRTGTESPGERQARRLFESLHAKPIRPMTWIEAECVKLCYNTYLGLKVLFANTVMELCHRLPGADCDVVNGTLKLATDRLVSTRYMDGGMADGGPCHGRDQMAMSFVARQCELRFNIFDAINFGRDDQTRWLADVIEEHREGRAVVLLGMAFKPGTNQLQGSPAMLLANLLRERGIDPVLHDPAVRPDASLPSEPALYFIATRWPQYAHWPFTPGDVVIDPWRVVAQVQAGVRLIALGARETGADTTAARRLTSARPASRRVAGPAPASPAGRALATDSA
jgi:UDPglucose 6-dehydrogenase